LALAGGSAIQHALFSNHQEKKQENQSPPEIKKSGEKTAKEDNAATKDLFGDPLPKGALARLGSLRFRHTGYIYGVRYSPDGKVLATTDTLHLYFWKADTGELIRKDEGAIFRVIAFSEDGKMLAGADYDLGDKDCRTMRVCIWNAATGEEVHRFKKSVANGRWVQGVASPVAAFAPDNKSLASAWDDGTVRIWEIPTGKELLKLEVEASGLAFSPDGKKLAIIGGRELGLWDPGTGEEIQKFEGEQGTLVAFSRDGKMLASTDKRMARVKLWDPTTGNLLEQFNPEGLVDALTFSHDGKMLAAGGFGETAVRIWDLPNDKQMRKLKGVPRFVHSLDFAPDGKTLALGGQSLVLQRWDPRTGKQLDRKEEQDDYMLRLAFSPDNKILATAGLGQSVRLWDSVTGNALRKLEDLDAQSAEGVSPLAFTPDGKSLVGIGGLKKGASAETLDTIVLWNPAEGKVCHRFGVSGRVFNTAAFSPDGRALATAEHSITQHLNPFTHKDAWETGVVRLWNPVSGEQIWKVTLGQQISALAFSADGKMLAVGGGLQKCVRLLDANTGKETHSWQAEVPVTALAFFPQGEVLITSPDGMLRNVATGKKLRLLEYEKTDKDGFAWPRALSVSPDGRMLATRNGPRKIGMWEIASGRQRCSFTHFLQSMEFVAFSPDGKRLATTCDDGTALIWDVTGQGQPRRAVRLTPEALEILWSELESADAEKAYQALQTLAAVPEQTVGLLKERLSPSNSNVKQAVSLAADLDSNGFEARGNAREELAKLEGVAEPALRQDLKKNPSAKAEKTILDQLSQLDPGRSTSSYVIRTKRAIEVLEWLGTAEAKKLLQSLSERKPPDLCAQEAKAALNRLEAAP
jgi:WD40 repeat protein